MPELNTTIRCESTQWNIKQLFEKQGAMKFAYTCKGMESIMMWNEMSQKVQRA